MTREFRLNRLMQLYTITATVMVMLLLAIAYFVSIDWLIILAMFGAAGLLLFFLEDTIFALAATPDRSLIIIVVLAVPGLMLLGTLVSMLQIPIFVVVIIILLFGLRWKVAPQLIEVSLTHIRLPSRYSEWRWEHFTDIRRTQKHLALYVGDELVFNLPRVDDREALYDIIVDQVEVPLMHRMLAKMRDGAVINFPNIKLTRELVVIDKDAIPVKDIENAVLDRWRHLSIYANHNGTRHVDVQHYVLAEELIKEQHSVDLGNRRDVHILRSPLAAILCKSGIVWRPPRKYIEVYDDGVIISDCNAVNRWHWEDFSEITTSNNRTRLFIDGNMVADIPGLLKVD